MEEHLELNPNSVNGLSESTTPLVDDEPVLSSHALAALKEFFAEQQSHSATVSDAEYSEKVALVSEDWRLSQFWYSSDTTTTVAEEVLTLCDSVDYRVACIACPTLYAYLKLVEINERA